MRLVKRSRLRIALGLVRAQAVKLWYRRAGEIGRLVTLDRGVSVFLLEGGRLRLGTRVHIGREVEIQARGGVVSLGDGTGLNAYSRIVAFERIEIGARCAIAAFVTILDHDHAFGADGGMRGYDTAPIRIGDDVWIGDKATVLKGVTIGDGATVAAGSVVTRDVAPGTVVAGVPARVIRAGRREVGNGAGDGSEKPVQDGTKTA